MTSISSGKYDVYLLQRILKRVTHTKYPERTEKNAIHFTQLVYIKCC